MSKVQCPKSGEQINHREHRGTQRARSPAPVLRSAVRGSAVRGSAVRGRPSVVQWNRLRYSIETMKAFTISASTKLPLCSFNFPSQKS